MKWLCLAELLLLVAIWESPIVPETLSYCEQDKNAQCPKENCATYDVTLVVLWKSGKFFDDHNGAIVAFFTIILAAFTVKLARSTDRLVKSAEETAVRQLRAYVLVESIYMDDKENILAKFKNFGQTPATDARSFLSATLGPFPFNPSPDAKRIAPQFGSCMTIGPGQIVEMPVSRKYWIFGQLRLEDSKFRDRSEAIWVTGQIRYIDAFGKPKTTDVRFFCTGENWREGKFQTYSEGNECT